MYVNTLLHCHFCVQIITDHFLLNKVSHPIHIIPGINAHLLYPMLCPWKYSIRHKLLYCPVYMFGCFHGNQYCVASCHYFYTWGGGGSTGSGYHLYGETLSVFSFTNGHCQQHPWIGHMVGGIPDHNDGSICWQLKTQ